MIKLVKFEIKKHFLKVSMAVVILLFLIINVVKINVIYNDKGIFSKQNLSEFKDVYWDCFKDYGGEITNEKIEKLMSIYHPIQERIADRTLSTAYDEESYTYNSHSDEIFFRWCFVDEMKYDYFYQQYAKDLVSNAKNNIEFYQSVGNQYMSMENYKIAMLFANREIKNFTYTEKYLYYLQYDFSILLVLLICIYGLSNVFVIEKETEMDRILITTKKGGRLTVFAKVLASILFVIIVCFAFWLEDFIVFSVLFDSFGENNSPLYALEIFMNTPLNVELLQFGFLSGILKTLGMLIFCIVFLLFSTICKKTLFSYIASFAAMFALLTIHDVDFIQGRVFQKIVSPVSLLVNRELFNEAEYLDIWGYPVPVYCLTLIMGLIWGILLFICIALFIRKNILREKGYVGRKKDAPGGL